MHFIGSSCSWNLGTTFSSSASFFPGERVGTMQLVSGGQGLPCRLPRCLFLAYINRRLHTFVASRDRGRGRGRRLAIATALQRIQESLRNRTSIAYLYSLHTRVSCIYTRIPGWFT